MIQNPLIPTVRVTTPTTRGTTSNFASSSHPASGRFRLVFTEQFLSNLLTTTLSCTADSDDPAIPMVTMTGGNVRTDMIYNAIMLRRSGMCWCPCGNPYTFRAIRMYDPDRIVICDKLPISSRGLTGGSTAVEEPSTTGNTTPTPVEDDDDDPAKPDTRSGAEANSASTDLMGFGF